MDDRGARFSRRDFCRGLAGAGALILPGCHTGFESGDDHVEDRFQESLAGHARPLVLPSTPPGDFSFVWISDTHVTNLAHQCLDKIGRYCRETAAALVINSGDLTDNGHKSEFRDYLALLQENFPMPVINALGNHDTYNDGWTQFKRLIGPSAFTFVCGPCDFVFLDVANGTAGRDQLDWLDRELSRLSRPLRFVVGHYPIYEGSFQTPGSMGNTDERMNLFYLFKKYDVDFYLCGHLHAGSRYEVNGTTHIINGAASPGRPLTTDDYHFYRFKVSGNQVEVDKIHVDNLP